MYPTISHLIYDLSGLKIPLPIQTFGFWVAIAFIAASWIITKEFKRKESEGLLSLITTTKTIGKKLNTLEIITSTLIGFAIGFKGVYCLLNYSEFVNNPQAMMLSRQGELGAGILIAIISIYLKWKKNKKTRLSTPKEIKKTIHPYELVSNMTMIAIVSGVIGAKIFHNLENIDLFLANPIQQLISFSGLTFYGGLITGAFSVIFYARKYNININHLIDSFAPGLILAYGIGRIGCQMSGDGDWGTNNLAPKPEWMSFLPDWTWSYTFPHNVIRYGERMQDCGNKFWEPYCYELANPVWPTALYEVVMSFVIFTILWTIRKHIKIPGALFCLYLTFNGIERFFIEKIRINTEYNILGGITQAEIISVFLFLIGITGSFYLLWMKKRKVQ